MQAQMELLKHKENMSINEEFDNSEYLKKTSTHQTFNEYNERIKKNIYPAEQSIS